MGEFFLFPSLFTKLSMVGMLHGTQTIHTYQVTVSESHESGHFSCVNGKPGTLCPGSYKAAVKVLAGLCPHLETWMGQNLLPG